MKVQPGAIKGVMTTAVYSGANRNRIIRDGDSRGETFIVIMLTGDREAPAAGNDKATLIRWSY